MLSTCRDYRKTQLVLVVDLFYPILWIPLYKFIDVVPEVGTFEDWTWRLFMGWLAVTMFTCSGRALLKTFQDNDPKAVYRGMLQWLATSLFFCTIQWIANGVLDYWGAFWITIIIRFFLVIATALFILDVRRLSNDSTLENLSAGMQLSGSGSRLNSSFKCKVM